MAALAAGILAWLPLEFLLTREKLQGQVVQLRLRYVNQLSTEEFMRFKHETGTFLDDIDVYIKLCTYQGELCSEDTLYLSAGTLLYRALLLGDLRSYERLINTIHPHELLEKGERLLQTSLETSNVRVQALLLARFELLRDFEEDRPDAVLRLEDPASIPWTPQLLAYYLPRIRKILTLNHFVERPDLSGATLAGYCQAYSPAEFLAGVPGQTRANTRKNFLFGWTLAELRKYPFGQQPAITELEALPAEYQSKLLEAGYIPQNLPVQAIGDYLHYIRPGAVYQVLAAGVPVGQAMYGITRENPSTDFLRRCRAMLAVLARHPLPDSPAARDYLTFLRIMTGQQLPEIPDSLRTRAIGVAHPDLRAKAEPPMPESLFRVSKTKYDLQHLLRVVNFDLPNLQEDLWLFQAYGAVYQLLTEKKLFQELQRIRTVQGYDQGNPLLQDYPPKPEDGQENDVTDVTLQLLQKLRKYNRALPRSRILANTGWFTPVALALGFNQEEYDAAKRRAERFRFLTEDIQRQLQ